MFVLPVNGARKRLPQQQGPTF
ncbi:conserved protein of unknown function [Pseudomonas marincola]|uniref:Uncharacterized protein n=1 Tax=Pseudomonas marincola TaxID=437900 RepID=A0A653E074_9PSED|nr:conserved protein of unknown function [Pseudomonas marincola]